MVKEHYMYAVLASMAVASALFYAVLPYSAAAVTITNSVTSYSNTGGQHGADGTNGQDGADGADGEPGRDGTSVVHGTSNASVRITTVIDGEVVTEYRETKTSTGGEAHVEVSSGNASAFSFAGLPSSVSSSTDIDTPDLSEEKTTFYSLLSSLRVTLSTYVASFF